jgi:hypothetical protein
LRRFSGRALHVADGEDFVAAGIHELEVGGPEAECLGNVEVEVPHSLASANRTCVRPVTDRDHLAVLVPQREPATPAARLLKTSAAALRLPLDQLFSGAYFFSSSLLTTPPWSDGHSPDGVLSDASFPVMYASLVVSPGLVRTWSTVWVNVRLGSNMFG